MTPQKKSSRKLSSQRAKGGKKPQIPAYRTVLDIKENKFKSIMNRAMRKMFVSKAKVRTHVS